MTLDELLVLDMLREIKALERLQRSIVSLFAQAPSSSFYEWRCGLMAVEDRLAWLRDSLSREDPDLLAAVDDLYRLELLQSPETSCESHEVQRRERPAALPPGARIH
jgi:hypothetical protein